MRCTLDIFDFWILFNILIFSFVFISPLLRFQFPTVLRPFRFLLILVLIFTSPTTKYNNLISCQAEPLSPILCSHKGMLSMTTAVLQNVYADRAGLLVESLLIPFQID